MSAGEESDKKIEPIPLPLVKRIRAMASEIVRPSSEQLEEVVAMVLADWHAEQLRPDPPPGDWKESDPNQKSKSRRWRPKVDFTDPAEVEDWISERVEAAFRALRDGERSAYARREILASDSLDIYPSNLGSPDVVELDLAFYRLVRTLSQQEKEVLGELMESFHEPGLSIEAEDFRVSDLSLSDSRPFDHVLAERLGMTYRKFSTLKVRILDKLLAQLHG